MNKITKPTKGICKECGKEKIIVSKKYQLCQYHYKRMIFKKSSEKTVKKYKIKQISDKEKINKEKLHKTYEFIDNERPQMCEGCGKTSVPLSHSHILPKRTFKHLEADPENIRLHCYGYTGSCHEKWESLNYEKVKDMLDFEKNLLYLEKHSTVTYQKLKIQQDEYLDKN